MPAGTNPLDPAVLASPFRPATGPFMPRQQTSGFFGNVAPQGGNKPLNSDISVPQANNNQHGFQLTGQYSDVFAAQPDQVLPYVPPPTTGLIENMLGMHNNYAGASLPLLDMLLQEMTRRTSITDQYFQPEMALRQGLLDQIGSQDNSFLRDLLGMQEQMSRPQTSGSFYFKGF